MKYFIISDIHGYYDVMISSLQKAGFDNHNEDHQLIVCGDMFDRGKQSKEVFEYLFKLHTEKKATIIIGNHDIFLLDFLKGEFKRTMFDVKHNGHNETIKSFSGVALTGDNLKEVQTLINEKYPQLKDWLESLPLFYELENYIFVHGGIDGSMLDWKSMQTTRDFVWGKEIDLQPVLGKIVVAGHVRVAMIRKQTTDYNLLYLHSPECFDILYSEGKILIDRYVEVSQELNVLVLELNG